MMMTDTSLTADQSTIESSSSEPKDPLVHLSHALTRHQKHLINLYTSLGYQDPQRCASNKISELHIGILDTIENQAKEAEKEVLELTQRSIEISDQIKNLRIRLGDHNFIDLENELSTRENEALVPKLERLKKIETELINIKGEREIKVENVIRRLESFATVLDENYIKEAISRSGQSLRMGNVSGTNLSLEYIGRLEKECEGCELEIQRRTQLLNDHLNEIFNLWGHLSISPTQPPGSADYSPFDRSVLSHLGIKDIIITINGDIEAVGSCEPVKMVPKDENLEKAEARRTWLDGERQKREEIIQNCYDELCVLWSRLGVPEAEQEEFVESWRGLSDQSVSGYRSELERMIKARNEHMIIFVQNERELIVELWDQMYVSEQERDQVGIMKSEDYSEELLKAHEEKKMELIDDLNDRKKLLTILEKYFTLLKEAHELEIAEKDPNRFAKGTRGDPGKLLREEKIRKRVTKEKPKLENDLKTMIPRWENERGRPFMVNGSRFLDDLVIRLEQEAASKAEAAAARTRSKTAGSSANPVKRQQTGSQSRTASPVKRSRPESSSRSKPPVSIGMRGSANPFGSATPRAPSRAGSATSTTTSHRIAPQQTGSRMPTTRSMRSNSNFQAPGTLRPHMTGSSMSSYNPVTPTPVYRAPPMMMTTERKDKKKVLPTNHESETDQGSENFVQPVSRSVSAQSSCPGIPIGWPSQSIHVTDNDPKTTTTTTTTKTTTNISSARVQPTTAVKTSKSYTRIEINNNGNTTRLGNGMPPPPLKKGTFKPRPSSIMGPPPLPPPPIVGPTIIEGTKPIKDLPLPLSEIDRNEGGSCKVFNGILGNGGQRSISCSTSCSNGLSNNESVQSCIIKSDDF